MPVPHTGLDKLPSVLAEIESGISESLHRGAQLYAFRHGEVLANAAAGWARKGVEMRPDSVNLWLSAGKPVTSVAIAMLRERGEIDIDTPVAHYIPEFGVNGKNGITVRHVLTHTGGFIEAELADRLESREKIVAAICESPLAANWTPGERAAYQPTAGWHVLGELVLRVTGKPIEHFTAQEILQPLGMTDASLAWSNSLPPEGEGQDGGGARRGGPTSPIARWGEPISPLSLGERARVREKPVPAISPDRWSPMHRVTPGGELEPHPAYTVGATGSFARPGGSFRAPASSLARLYEMLLNGGELGGARLLTEDSVRDMTARHREGLVDETFGVKMDWGLGVIPNNNRYGPAIPYGYGPHASDSAFGHGGSMSSTGFADPTHGLAVALVFNGMPGHPKHDRRMRRTLTALYEDLGLA